jgi:hypothetical protein
VSEPTTHRPDSGPNGRWITRCVVDLAYWPCRTYQAAEAGVTTKAGASILGEFPSGEAVAAIEAEARALLLDELEAAVRELPTWDKRTVPGGFHVNRAAVLALIQQHREAIR